MNDEIEFTGEDNQEDIELEEAEASSNAKLKKLREQLKACEEEKMQHLEDVQRAKADFLNTKKRLEEEAVRSKERVLNTFIGSLLPIADSFDAATSTRAWEELDGDWKKGIEAIRSQLEHTLKSHDVETFGEVGEHFDPNRHDAMSTTDGDGESETVAEVLQKGFVRNGDVIRPAKVIIFN